MNDIKTAFNECLNIHANKLKLSMNRINKQKLAETTKQKQPNE